MNSVSAVSATFNPRPSLRILGGAVSVLTEPFSLLRKEEGGFSLFHCRGCRVSLTAYLFCFAVALPFQTKSTSVLPSADRSGFAQPPG